MLGFDRITIDPHVMGGRACLRGMRITVSLVVNLNRSTQDWHTSHVGSMGRCSGRGTQRRVAHRWRQAV